MKTAHIMSYVYPESWWWGPRSWFVPDYVDGSAVGRTTVRVGHGEPASDKFWRKLRLILFGFVGVAAGIGSMSLYRYNSDLFLVASTAFTMIYTLLTLFMSMRVQSPYRNNTDWGHAIEALSYFQLFNTFFVMLCVVEITFKSKNRSSFGNKQGSNGNSNSSGYEGRG